MSGRETAEIAIYVKLFSNSDSVSRITASITTTFFWTDMEGTKNASAFACKFVQSGTTLFCSAKNVCAPSMRSNRDFHSRASILRFVFHSLASFRARASMVFSKSIKKTFYMLASVEIRLYFLVLPCGRGTSVHPLRDRVIVDH